MRGLIQDVIRAWIGGCLCLLGRFYAFRHRRRVRSHVVDQAALRQRYDIGDDTEIHAFGAEQEAHIARFVEGCTEPVQMAETSGSTGRPKKLAYPKSRIEEVKGIYVEAFARLFVARGMRRWSFYVFSALSEDQSLSSLMLEEGKRTPYLSGLQAPYRLQRDPSFSPLVETYGVDALRLWVLALSNPGCLYCTNPSTLSTFLDAMESQWQQVSALARRFHESGLDGAGGRLARRLYSRGWRQRVERIATARSPLSLLDCAPAISLLCCWDGGYVRPFLDRIYGHLPRDRVPHVPMYSMSTETVATLPDFSGEGIAFLPMAPGVLYEFLPLDAAEAPTSLIAPEALEPGGEYTMVVSDAYGLRRYQTEDIFRCEGLVGGLPDLRFQRRRGLAWSFTGEKLTGEQLEEVLGQLRRIPGTEAWAWMSCAPSQPATGLPHYRLLLVGEGGAPTEAQRRELCTVFDAALSTINREYASKRQSGRLGEPGLESLELEEFVGLVGGDRQRKGWQSQFKFLPLVCRSWEALKG